MARVVEQADRFSAPGHQFADLRVGLDDRAHVVMERHPHAEISHALGERRDLGAVGGPFVGGETRPLRDRVGDGAVASPRGVGIDDMFGAEVAQQREMRQDRLELLAHGLLADPAVVPARHQLQPVGGKDRTEKRALARKLAAELRAGVAGLLRLGEADLERRVAAERRIVVVRPGDRVDAELDGHAVVLALEGASSGRWTHCPEAAESRIASQRRPMRAASARSG